MKKTYRTNRFGTKIDVFDVERETDSSVWLKLKGMKKPEQFRKVSDSFSFFDTLSEAKQHRIKRYENEIEYHEKQICFIRESIKEVQAQEIE